MRACSRGFSLLELLTVVVIIGLVLAAGVPGFGAYRKTLRARQAREQVVRDIRTSRQSAIARHTPYVLRFESTGTRTRYWIHTDTNGDRILQSSELQTTRVLPQGTLLQSVSLVPPDTLIFDSSGILSPGTTGGSLVLSNGARAETLQISAAGVVYER